jgi:hypothetical protein
VAPGTDADLARAAWTEAKAALAAFPTFSQASGGAAGPDRASGPDPEWYHSVAQLELREIEARHLLQRTKAAARPRRTGKLVTFGELERACRTAISRSGHGDAERQILVDELHRSTALYADAGEDGSLSASERQRVVFRLGHAPV